MATRTDSVRVQAALGDVEYTADTSRQARADYETAIKVAHQLGASTRTIAKHAGVSHQRVWQIINDK